MSKSEQMWGIKNTHDDSIHAVGRTRDAAIKLFLCGTAGWQKWYRHGFRAVRVLVTEAQALAASPAPDQFTSGESGEPYASSTEAEIRSSWRIAAASSILAQLPAASGTARDDGTLLVSIKDVRELADALSRLTNAGAVEPAGDELTGCADDQIWSGVSADDMRRAVEPAGDQKAVAEPVEGGDGRDMKGETYLGLRVAAWREDSRHGDKFPHVYSEHWSTPGLGAQNVERLFTEHQVATLTARLRQYEAAIERADREIGAVFDEIIRHALNPVIRQAAECGKFTLAELRAVQVKP